MPATSCGLLLWRLADHGGGPAVEVLLVHPGGPYWAHKDDGAWSIPKGETDDDDLAAVAAREFAEELGTPPPGTPASWVDLGEIRQSGGKRVRAWATEGDLDPAALASNTFELEWPPRSGRRQSFPEVDRAQWFGVEEARRKLLAGQVALLDRLLGGLSPPSAGPGGSPA